MVVVEAAFNVLVLTEDGTKHTWQTAFATIRDLAKKLFRHLDDRCETQRIDFSPMEDEQLRELLTANRFTNRRHPHRYRLYQRIAAELKADGFILHHVDADRAWDPPPPLNDNEAAVRTHIIERVRRLFEDNNVPRDEIEEMLRRYLLIVPYWEIEAWLYQNSERAAPHCPGEPHCHRQPSCRSRLAGWRDDRGALDEVEHVSEALCFGKHHNADLVQGYPTAEVVAAGKSLAAAVDAMLGCDALLHALQRTYETSPGVLEST